MLMLTYLLILSLFSVALSFNIRYNRYQLSSLSLSSESSVSIVPSLPIGAIIATNNNLKDEHLEIIDDILFSAVSQKLQPPVFIVGKNDMRLTLKNILVDNNALLDIRDHDIPNDINSVKLSIKNVPIILLSGFERDEVRNIIRSVKTWNGPSSGIFPKIAFAMVVQPALDKTLDQLFNEILNDFSEEVNMKIK